MRRALLSVVLAPVLLGGTPALAAASAVDVHTTVVLRPNRDAGYIAVAECDALVEPVLATEVALSTTVTCDIGGVSTTRTANGPASVTTVVRAVVSTPVLVCATATATIYNYATGQAELVSDEFCALAG